MPLSSALKFRNKNIKATYAIITDNVVTCKTNTPITPFTPVTGSNGVPFKDPGTGATYYEYFVDPSGLPLPAGLTLNPTTGQITGTPTVTTVVSALVFSTICKIAVRDSRNRKAYKVSTLTFIVVDDLVAVNTTNNKVTGVVNSVEANVPLFTSITGGRPPYVYSVTAGTLPPGVTLDQLTGKLIGKATDTKRTFTDPLQTEVLPLTAPVEITVEDFYGTKVSNHTIVDFDIVDLVIATPAQATDYTITGMIPLTINFHAFTSVVAGTPPYTYFTPAAQKDLTPDGLVLNGATGDITGVYTGGSATKVVGGVTVPDLKEYSGTLKVSVKDSTNAIASKIANIKINAYLHFEVETLDVLSTGGPQTSYDAVQFKPIAHTPFKGKYGVPPYTFRFVSYKYTDKLGAITTSTSLPTGVTLTASNGKLETTTGLPSGSYEFTLDAIDSTNVVATGFVPITFNVSDAVAANSLTTVKSYEMYVGDTSALTTGVDILSADLGIPPYTFSVTPTLPAGLTLSTTANKCTLIGTATDATDKTYVFSVKDSTGASAIVTESIALLIVDHFTSSNNITDIEAFIDDPVVPIDIFDFIKGGYPPYTVTQLSGTLRPELTVVPMGYTYVDNAKGKTITTTTPQMWGYIMVTGAAGATPLLGQNHNYGYASMDTFTFKVTDSRGNVSPNIATLNYKVYKRLRGTATRIPPTVSGVAEFTNVSFKPITPAGGIPPYTVNFTTSITDLTKKPPVKTTLPKLGLKAIQPDTIAGIPSAGYTGLLYYYMTDSVGSRTDNIPVKFNIIPKINAVKYSKPLEVMYVRGYDKYEITDTSGASPVVTTSTTLKVPFFKSVTGGTVPYVYYLVTPTAAPGAPALPPALPTGFFIDNLGFLNGDSTTKPSAYATKTITCGVVDYNLVSGGDKTGSVILTINDELSTTLVDNATVNAAAVTSFHGSISNSKVDFNTGNTFTPFTLVRGKNGSGRYSYMFDLTTPSVNNVLDYFQINGTTGRVTLKPSAGGSAFNSEMDVSFGIKVTDTFTGIFKIVSNVLRLKVINAIAIAPVISGGIYNYEKDSVHNNDLIFNITGGSGQYDFVSVTPALPGSLTFTSSVGVTPAGGITGTANTVSALTEYTVKYKDRVYNTLVSSKIKFSVTSDYVIIPLAGSSSPVSVSLATVQTASAMTYAQLLSTPIKIRIDVNGTVRSNTVNTPALTVNLPTGLNSGTTIKVLTKTGSIIGRGGKGGEPSTDPAVRNGQSGGAALKLNTGNLAVEVESLPGTFISGGGGGGGAGGDGWKVVYGNTMNIYQLFGYSGLRQRQVSSGGTLIWSPDGLATIEARVSYKIDTMYKPRDNSVIFPVHNLSDDYTSIDPDHPTDPKYRLYFNSSRMPAASWDFDNGTGFTPQTPTSKTGFQPGSAGGNGFGYVPSGSTVVGPATSGQSGTISAPTASGVSEAVPSDNLIKILIAEWNALLSRVPAVIGNGMLVLDSLTHNDITPATPGSGVDFGAGGTSPDPTSQAKPYLYAAGLGGGGGGGKGGDGGDGGTASDLPAGITIPSLKLAGVGGVAGPAILTTATTAIPTLLTSSLVYGDVL